MKDESPGKSPDSSAQLAPAGASALFRQATDVAHLCREIVLKCVVVIGERRYVKVEGWMAISVAHGCIASIKSVEMVPGEGVKCVAEIRRIEDQAILASAEGFVGMDEPDWYGGEVTRLNKRKRPPVEETMMVKKRPDYAIRAMAQTRGISRVLRAGFSHVLVLIDHKLETIPANEITDLDHPGDDDDGDRPQRPDHFPKSSEKKTAAAGASATAAASTPAPAGSEAGGKKEVHVPREESLHLREQFRGRKWEQREIHFGDKSKGKRLGELSAGSLKWWINDWQPRQLGTRPIPQEDWLLRAALDVAAEETEGDK